MISVLSRGASSKFGYLLSLVLLAFTFSIALARAGSVGSSSPQKVVSCSDLFFIETNLQKSELSVAQFWLDETLLEQDTVPLRRAVVIWEFAEYFRKHKKFPMRLELLEGLRRSSYAKLLKDVNWSEFVRDENLNSDVLITLAVTHLPERFADLLDQLDRISVTLFQKYLRIPTYSEIAKESSLKGSLEDQQKIVQLLVNRDKLIEKWKRESHEVIGKVSSRILAAFTRAAFQADRAKSQRTPPTLPSYQAIHAALIRPQTNFEVRMQALNGEFAESDLKTLVESIFGGIDQLEKLAVAEKPSKFNSYRPTWATIDRMVELRTWIEQKNGFLMTSVNSGIPININQFKTMLALAEERDLAIVVVPTIQILDKLPNELFEHPRVFILTHTIKNKFINISNIPIAPKNSNPSASLHRRRQFTPGAIKIIGHPQISMMTVPTGTNHMRETEIWSTGSLSQNLYPYAMPIQGRTSYIAKENHINGFLIVEKSDGEAGLTGEGTQNVFHVRDIVFKNDPKDPVEGFTDLGHHFFVRKDDPNAQVQKAIQQPQVLVRGDLHDLISDQRFIESHKDLLLRYTGIKQVVDHDTIDGATFNHHQFDDNALLARQVQDGTNSIEREYEGVVASKNAILNIRPDIRTSDVNSNHPRWMERLIKTGKIPQVIEVNNKKFIEELRMAATVYNVSDPLMWVLKYRNEWMDSLKGPVKKDYEGKIRIIDPERVEVLPLGKPFTYGPEHRETHLENHGDKGANGAKGSAQTHAAGNWSSITGDSHVSGILGNWYNVGTSTPKRVGYSMGGYSAWSNSAALLYPDGTKQMLIYRSIAGTMFQRPEKSMLAPHEFFGRDTLEVIENDNDLLPEEEIYDQHSDWLKRWRNVFGGN